MTSIEKSIFPQVVVMVVGCVLMLGCLHPKMSKLMFTPHQPLADDQNLSANDRWQLNDQYYFGYRLPPASTIPDGPWLSDYPTLKGKSFAQVSILQSRHNYSLDLVLDSSASAKKLTADLRAESPAALVNLFSPEEAEAANGYYFENKELHHKYWVNISRYQL